MNGPADDRLLIIHHHARLSSWHCNAATNTVIMKQQMKADMETGHNTSVLTRLTTGSANYDKHVLLPAAHAIFPSKLQYC